MAPEAVSQTHTDVAPWMRATIESIETVSKWTGIVTAWLIVPMTIAVTWEVVIGRVT